MAHSDESVLDGAEGTPWLRQLVVAVPVVTAVVLGSLYGLGAFFKAAELHAAGLSVTATLPLVPIQQLLTGGMAILYTHAVAIALCMSWLAGLYFMGSGFSALIQRGGVTNLADDIDETLRKSELMVDRLEEGKSELEELKRRAALGGGLNSEFIRRVEESRQHHEAATESAIDSRARMRQVSAEARRLTRADWIIDPSPKARLARSGLFLAISIVLLLQPPAVAIGLGVPIAAWALVPTVRTISFGRYAAGGVAFLLGTILVAVALGSRELPVVTLLTANAEYRGGLVASTGDTWYVQVGETDKFDAVTAASLVLPARVVPPPSGRQRSLLEVIRDAI